MAQVSSMRPEFELSTHMKSLAQLYTGLLTPASWRQRQERLGCWLSVHLQLQYESLSQVTRSEQDRVGVLNPAPTLSYTIIWNLAVIRHLYFI